MAGLHAIVPQRISSIPVIPVYSGFLWSYFLVVIGKERTFSEVLALKGVTVSLFYKVIFLSFFPD